MVKFRWDRRFQVLFLLPLLILSLTACPGNPPPAPDFTISLNPTSLSIQQGGSGTTQLTITPLNGFTGTVNLELVGAPSGVTLSPTSVNVTGSDPVTRDLTVSVAASVAPGTYNLQVRATSGSLTKTANLTLTVTAAPDFTISLNPTSLSIQQGGSGTTQLTITPLNGFTGTVNLELVGAPSGVTLSPTSVNVTGSDPVTRDLTVSVAASVAPGTYNLQVRATSGSLTKTANLTLTVTAAPDFTISLNPTSLSIQQGGSGTTQLTITPLNGFTGTVNLELVGAPSGVTLSPTSVNVTGSDPVTRDLTVSVAASVAPGTYNLQVRATSGSLTKTANLTLTVTAAPDFTISLNPTSLSIQQGGSGTTQLTITPLNGFTGTVNLELVGAPSGVTLSPTSVNVTGSDPVTRDLTVSVAASVAPGTYNLQVRATSGSLTKTANLTLTVTAAPDFTISLNPTSLSIQQGGSGTTQLTITPLNGFTGTVNLELVGAPSGVTLSPTSVNVTGSDPVTRDLTVSVAASVAPGTYNLQVRATSGSLTKTANLTLTVTAAPDFTISLNPTSLSIQQGGSGTTQLTITPLNGFTGTVNLELVGAPSGVTLSPTSVNVTGSDPVTRDLTVSVAASVAPGTYNLQVRATSGSLTKTANLTLTVTAAPDFTISLNPTSLSIQQGGSGTTQLTITPLNGFTGTVNLELVGAPSGVTLSPTSVNVTGSDPVTRDLTVSVAASVAPGTYNLQVRATSGSLTKTANLTLTVTAAPDFTISLNPTSLSIQQGGSGTTQLTITPLNGFTGTVNLELVGAPSGVTLSPTSVNVTGSDPVTRDLTVSVAASVAPGTYNLQVRATSGSLTKTANLTLTVTAAPDFTISLNPTSLSIQQGGSGTTQLTITPLNGFTGTVNLELVGAPSGVTLSPTSVNVTGSDPVTRDLTVSVAASVAPGTYNLQVRATSGSLTKTANLTLTVTAAPDFTISLNPTSLSIQQGGSGTTQLTITPLNGFTGTVNLELVGAPSGVTLSPTSVNVTGSDPVTRDLTVSVAASVAPGTYNLQVRATSGSLTKTANLTLTVTAAPDFTISLNPTSLSIQQGGSGTTQLTITPLNGFTGTVNLELVGAPSGVTLSPTSVNVTGSDPVTRDLTVSVAASVAPGTYNLQVRATSGSLTKTANLTLTVTAAPDFTISLNPTSLSIQQGGSGTTQLTITPLNGFTGTVNLELVGAPSGVTLSPTSVNVTGSDPVTRDLTVSVAASVAPGTYNLQVRATSGSLTKTANLTLTVTAAPDFTISLNPTSLSIQQGGSGTTQLTITPLNGFTGTVNLELVGAPSGVTLSPTSVNVTGSDPVTRDLTVSVAASVAPGTYNLQVRATSGSLTKTANLTLTVTAAPDFTISLNPTSLSIQQGGSGTTQLTITPLNGFTGTVNLELVGAPSGVTLSPTSVNVTGSDPVTRDLTVSVAASVAPGTYNLQVRATSGSLTKTANLTLTVTAAPDFTISLNPTSLSIQQGGSGTTQLTITPLNGFTGTVNLELVGAPSGVTLSPTSVNVTGSDPVTRDLTVSVAASVAPGTYNLQVRATSGSLTKTANLTLTVTAAPDFTISLNPTSLSIQQGGSGTTQLTITPLNGFTGTVNLELVGAPSGVTLSPTSVNVTGSDPVTRDLTVSVAASVAPGTYNLQVRATSGSLTKTANLTLTVTAAPDFTISLNPTSLSIQQGGSGTTQLTITPLNGFTGTVNLELVGAPSGVTLSPTSVNVTGSDPVTRDLTVSVAASVAPGTYNLQVRATSGSLTKTANLTLTVTAAPDFTISLNPTSLSIQQGGSGTTQLTITPLNGFTGTVNLELVGAPSGVTLSPTSVNVTGSDPVTRDLTVSVAASVAPGTYNLQVRATSGSLTKTANLTLTVTAASTEARLVPEVTGVSSNGLRFTVKVFLEGVSTDWGGFEFRATFDNPGFRLSNAITGDLTAACILDFDSNSGRVAAICPSDINGSGHIATLTIERQSPSQATTLSLVDGLLTLSDFSELPLAPGSVRLE